MIKEDLLKNNLLYHARAILKSLPTPLDGVGITPDSDKHVHVILQGDDELVLALARYVALIAHYPNFNETTGANRTVITLVSPTMSVDKMKKSQLFGNLPDCCPISVIDKEGNETRCPGECGYLDIAFQLILQDPKTYDYQPLSNEILTRIDTADSVALKKEDGMVDVTGAQLINMVYHVGFDLSHIDLKNIADVKAYRRAVLRYGLVIWDKRQCRTLWEKCKQEDKLSSFYLTECIECYKRSICTGGRWSKQRLYQCLPYLTKTEHIRWSVSKLIDGFRPYSMPELVHYSTLSAKEKEIDKKEKKLQKIHLDICSNEDLKSYDYNAVKYDTVLLLVMPQIVK